MRSGKHPSRRWLLSVTAVAVGAWLLASVAGCHLPHSGHHHSPAASVSTVAGDTMGISAPHAPSMSAKCCKAGLTGCDALMQACRTLNLVALGVIITLAAIVGSLTGPILASTRAPPRRIPALHHHTGQDILTRLCISRR